MVNGDDSKGTTSLEGTDIEACPAAEEDHAREAPSGHRYGNNMCRAQK
jgi:hypothetical protein